MKIFFIHWGDTSYLNYSLYQSLLYGNDTILLKDRYLEYPSIEISRWFTLNKYLKENNINRCLYLDSDCLIFTNPEKDFLDCDFTLSKQHCGHVMFINNRKILDDFCTYVRDTPFTIEMVNKTRERIPDGIFVETPGDMVYWNNFVFETNYIVNDTSKLLLTPGFDPTTYDHNINVGDGFRIKDGIKDIRWIMREPYCYFDSYLVKFNSLHFQGNRKGLMKECLTT